MLLRSLVLSLAVCLSVSRISAQDKPAPSYYPLPLLHQCSATNPPPCIDKPPVIVHSPDPAYPKDTQKKKGQGGVILQLIVGTDGLPHDIHVTGSLGPGFDAEAIKAVRQWRFKPATSDGKPVSDWISINVIFVVAR